MNEVGGSESGTGLRAIKSSRSSDANFEYDDSEWDVGIGNLIIDLDADIEKNNEANRNNNNSSSAGQSAGSLSATSGGSGSSLSSVTSPGSGSTSNPQMHIPLTSSSGSNSGNSKSAKPSSSKGSNSSDTTVMEHSSVVDKGLKMKIKRTKTGTKSGADAKHEIVKSEVVGSSSSNGTGSSSGNNSSGGYSSNNKSSLSDSISSTKNSHSSHKDRDKGLMKDANIFDNSHESGSGSSINSKMQDNSSDHSTTAGGKVKTPRKGSTKEKKVKNSNVGNSGNSKKDEKNSNEGNGKGNLSNSNSSTTSSIGSHGKDNKEFFSTTVNLNVPNVIPNSSSSAFVKTTATIKIPTAPTSALSSSSGNSSSGGGNLHNVHSSGGNGGGDSSSSSSNCRNLSSSNSSTNSVSSNSPWTAPSPSKGDKGHLSPSVSNLNSVSEKSTTGSYKKARSFQGAASDKSGSSQDENSSGSHSSSSTSTSYRNQGALSINSNSATDLSSSSSSFSQGTTGSQHGNGGSGISSSSKETGKRNSVSATAPTTQDVCVGTSVGTVTEPDCLGPCEPGTSVTLEGIVWHETESGVLVVNVTWRGKTYVGTLIDCTKNDWAPPRFCDSPTSDLEMRTPKNRGKRGRAQAATPVNEPVVADTRSANAKLRNGAKGRRGSNTATTAFVAPASPVKPEAWPKRKTRGSENESQEEVNPKSAKRPKVSKDSDRKDRRSNSPAADEKSGPSSPQLIECPEPNCSKKYKHINGLRYHQSHAHTNNFVAAEDSDSNMSTASTTNTSAPPDPPGSNNADNAVEPMIVDNEIPTDGSTNTSQPSSVADEPVSTPSTPGKKTSTTPPATATPTKVDDKIYDLSADADLNPTNKDSTSSVHDGPEPYSSKASIKSGITSKSQQNQNKESHNSNDSDSKIVPENLSKDSTPAPSPSTTSSSTTLTPRTPILTVPVVPYMSLQSRNMVHGHVVNVPRVETSHNSRDNENTNSAMKNSGNQSTTSKNAPWQPHAQSGHSSHHSSHVMNTSPPSSSITVPLNIPMNIPEKLGGGSLKDKNSSSDQSSRKNKHKKKSKDKEKERDGKSKDSKDKGDMGKGLNIPIPGGGPSDYSRSSGLFHNSSMGSDSIRSKDVGSSGDDNDSSRKNSLDNRDDPQSPAYSDISDANDSGPDAELNVGGGMKDSGCKGLVIPGGDPKKEPMSVQSVPGGPPFHQSFFNHNLHSPYLDSLGYAARQAKESPEGRGPPANSGGSSSDDTDKNRPGSGPIKHPSLPPNPQVPAASSTPSGPNEDSRRSPKMDYHGHPKYPYPNYFSYPYSSFHPYSDHPSFPNPMPPENSFSSPGQGRMYPGMEDKDGAGNSISGKVPVKPVVEKDDGPMNVQIKQEPVEREEPRRSKEKPQTSAFAMNIDQDKGIEIKSEFGIDHSNEQKLIPPYMSNSSSKHKEHKRNSEDSRHDRRHDGKDMDGKLDGKSSRNSSSMMNDKGKGSSIEEPSETKERKDEGAKPTMETTGPPPPPTASAYYLPQGYLPGNPFGLPFDPSHPLYRQVLVPGHFPGNPYMHPGQIPRFPSPGGPTPLPEDLSRPGPGGPPGNPSKALDLLQHHAAQYYNSHKIHELQERALKSPSPQVANQRGPIDRDGPHGGGAPPSSSPGHSLGGPGGSHSGRGGVGSSVNSGMPKPADLSKDSKPTIGPGGSILSGVPTSDSVRTPPPTQHHVHSHTHHHTHVGIGYPIIPSIPAVSPQYSPHAYGVLATPPAAPSVIPPFPPQKPS